MMGGHFTNAAAFVVDTVFSLYAVLALVRFWLHFCGADIYHPVSQFVVRMTEPAVMLLRKLVPNPRGVDVPSIALLFVTELLRVWLLAALSDWPLAGLAQPLILALALSLRAFFYLLIILVIARAVMSWFAPGRNPLYHLIVTATEPVMRWPRSILPPFGGLDLSPILLLLALGVLLQMLVNPLMQMAGGLAGLVG